MQEIEAKRGRPLGAPVNGSPLPYMSWSVVMQVLLSS
jgi:hypothetical protein